ncbi:MAG TPA: STAS domain-containing protein, partial [Baekduia sp.]|nr:STAS domain-containing protein [Baekduia sp.]
RRVFPVPTMSFAEPRFRTTERDADDRTTIVAVDGEIHVSTAPEFSGALGAAIEDGRTQVVLDLSEVTFIDSTGLSVLLAALRRTTRAGGRMALVCTNPTVLRLFEVTRLDSTFDIHAGLEPAIAAVQAPAGGSDSGAP